MNKAELVRAISQRSGLTQKAAGQALDALVAVVSEALAGGDEVRVQDFGTFRVVVRKERAGRNPRTGEAVRIPGGPAPVFRPGTGLRRAVAG